jgi:hypothetical protein
MNDRKLDIGATISQAFSIYGSQAGVLLPVAFGLFLVVAVINGLLAGSFILLPLTFAVSIVASTLYQGMVVQLVRDVQDGRRDSSASQLIESATPFILPLIGAGLLAGIAIGVGFLFLIVPGLILLTIWSVLGPSIVVERKGVLDAFGRSRELVKGHGWQVFGVIFVVFLIVFIVSAVLGAIGTSIDDSAVMRIIFYLVGQTITAPIGALVAGVLYFSLRDLEGGAPAAASEPTAASAAPTTPATPAAPDAGTTPPAAQPPVQSDPPPPGPTNP